MEVGLYMIEDGVDVPGISFIDRRPAAWKLNAQLSDVVDVLGASS